LAEPSNVVAVAEDNFMAFGAKAVIRYYYGYEGARSFARIPRLGPYEVWPDPTHVDAFWIRYLGEPLLHYVELRDVNSRAQSDRTVPPVTLLGESRALPDFDRRHFTLLADGSALYTAGQRLVRASRSGHEVVPLPPSLGTMAAIWPDAALGHFWAVDDTGAAKQVSLSKGRPVVRELQLAGLPLHHAQARQYLAALSANDTATGPELTLEVFSRDGLVARWPIADVPPIVNQGFASELDLCFVQRRPVIVVGGPAWLMVFDYRSRVGRRL
jgi:hypothetical protein